MWIIHIKLKCFKWKFFLGSGHKGKENISVDNLTDLWQNKISELYIENNVYVYVNRQTFVWVIDYIWEKYIWYWKRIIGIFHFFN